MKRTLLALIVFCLHGVLHAADSIMLIAATEQPEAFIHQQIFYTVKLYNNGRLINTNYKPPEAADALIVPVKGTLRYHETVDDEDFNVEVQRYLIFPQKAGPLKITPPVISGLVYNFNPRRITVSANETAINIKPVPLEANSKNWLPARNVAISESYDSSESYQTGATIKRIITIEATGLLAELFPEITFTGNDSIDVWQGKTITDNILQQQDVVGSVSIEVNCMLTRSGNIALPEIRIPWYNTITGTHEVTTLPGRILHVQPAVTAPDLIKEKGEGETIPDPHTDLRPLVSQIVLLIFTLLLIGWLIILRKKHQQHPLKSFKAACYANNPQAARATLGAVMTTPQDQIDGALRAALDELNHVLYSKEKLQWEGKKLYLLVKNYRHKPARAHKRDLLKPVNPW